MPTTVTATVQLFTLDELDDRARERAIEAYQDCNVDFQEWHEAVLEMCEEELTAAGIQSPKIHYSGFWSQGDGASFTGSLNLAEWMQSQKLGNKYRTLYNAAKEGGAHGEIYRSSYQSVHENSTTARIEITDYPDNAAQCERLEQQAAAVEELLEEWRRDKCHEIYKDLRDAYEYLTGAEAIAETIEANEWRFLEDGTPEHQARLWRHYQ